MSTKRKTQKPVEGHSRHDLPRFDRIVLIEASDVDFFSNQTLLNEISLSKEVKREISPDSYINKLKKTERLDEVPELIFIDLKMNKMDGYRFIEEFSRLSDFVRKKCKIVVLAKPGEQEVRDRILLNPNVVRYFEKPLDAVRLKEFLDIKSADKEKGK